ncbi:hypothetical protein HZC35_01745 [Candidatus Saganbacteria bacterium]|nr:hypothetical protein [Candidatus Saganbacteria bacterium]
MALTLLTASAFGELAELGLTALRADVGPRRLGMGMTGSGIIDDIFALYNNPGALPWAKGVAVTLQDLSNTSAAQSYPTGSGTTLALGVTAGKTESFSTSGGAVNSSSYDSLSLAAGTRLEVGGKNLGVGFTLNSLVGQTLLRPGQIDATGNGWDLDVGLLYRYLPWLNLGASAHNILPANTLGGGVIRWTNGNREGIPVFYRAGASARLIGEVSPWQIEGQDFLLNGDYEYVGLTRQSNFRLGWEWAIDQKYFLRLGFSPDLAWGAGMKFGDWQTDFSISKNPLKDEKQIFFSLSFYPTEWMILSQPVKRLNIAAGDRTYYPSIEAQGEVWPGVKLKINSQPVALGEDNRFSRNLPLARGENLLLFETWYEGERAEKKITITRDPLPRSPVKRLSIVNGQIFYIDALTITGLVEPGSRLTINGREIPIAEDQSFAASLSLLPGKNLIRFGNHLGGQDIYQDYEVYFGPVAKVPAAAKRAVKKIKAPVTKKPAPPKMLKALPKKPKPAPPAPPPPPPKPAKPIPIPSPVKAQTQLAMELEKFKKEIKERALQEADQKKFLALQALLKEKTGFTITGRVKIKLPKGYLAVYLLVDEQYVALRHLGGGRVSIDSYNAIEGLWATQAVVPYSEIKNLL